MNINFICCVFAKQFKKKNIYSILVIHFPVEKGMGKMVCDKRNKDGLSIYYILLSLLIYIMIVLICIDKLFNISLCSWRKKKYSSYFWLVWLKLAQFFIFFLMLPLSQLPCNVKDRFYNWILFFLFYFEHFSFWHWIRLMKYCWTRSRCQFFCSKFQRNIL